MSVSIGRLFVAGLLGAALLFHFAVAGQDFSVLAKNGFLYDDSFYAFKIAQNIAQGNGATFDGIHPTNGFQPLWVFLIAPFYKLYPSDLIAPVVAALMLSALFAALTAVLLYGIVRRYASRAVALFIAAIWVFSPVVTKQTANGLETALALFLFASVVYVYLTRIRAEENPRWRDFVLLGVLLGLAVLARVDEVFLALVVLLDYLLVLRRRKATSAALRGVGVAAVAALAVYGPWLAYNALSMGRVVQDSGSATRFLSLAYAPFFDLGSADVASSGPGADFIWRHVVHSFSVLKLSPPVHAFFRGVERIAGATGTEAWLILAGNLVGLGLIAAFLYVVVGRKRSLRVKGFDEVQFLLVYCAVIVTAYSLYVFGVFFFVRYYYPVYFVLCVYAGLLLQEVVERFRAGAAAAIWRRVVVAALALYTAAFAYMAYTCSCRSHAIYCFYDAAGWVEKNSSPDDTIGVFQSGAVGYFSNRRVINLDGKVNRDALRAIKTGRLGDYLREEGIDIVVDNRKVLELFLTGRFSEGQSDDALVLLGLHPIMNGEAGQGVPGWAAYRVNGFARSH